MKVQKNNNSSACCLLWLMCCAFHLALSSPAPASAPGPSPQLPCRFSHSILACTGAPRPMCLFSLPASSFAPVTQPQVCHGYATQHTGYDLIMVTADTPGQARLLCGSAMGHSAWWPDFIKSLPLKLSIQTAPSTSRMMLHHIRSARYLCVRKHLLFHPLLLTLL